MPQQPITLDPNSPAFDSIDEAANAFAASMPPTKGLENAGVLYKGPDNKYRYSTTMPGAQDHFALKAQVPKGSSFAGILHTHPGTDAMGQVFSPDVLGMSTQLKVPSYIRFQDGGVRKFVPGTTPTSQMPNPSSRVPYTVAKGDPLTLPPPPVASNNGVDPMAVVQRDSSTTQY